METRFFVKVGVIMQVSIWNKETIKIARKNDYVYWERRKEKNGYSYWYDLNSINPIFLKHHGSIVH